LVTAFLDVLLAELLPVLIPMDRVDIVPVEPPTDRA
jgi:hypothetical protein